MWSVSSSVWLLVGVSWHSLMPRRESEFLISGNFQVLWAGIDEEMGYGWGEANEKCPHKSASYWNGKVFVSVTFDEKVSKLIFHSLLFSMGHDMLPISGTQRVVSCRNILLFNSRFPVHSATHTMLSQASQVLCSTRKLEIKNENNQSIGEEQKKK